MLLRKSLQPLRGQLTGIDALGLVLCQQPLHLVEGFLGIADCTIDGLSICLLNNPLSLLRNCLQSLVMDLVWNTLDCFSLLHAPHLR